MFKLVIGVLALCVVGCSGSDVPAAKRTTGRNPLVAEVPGADETVRGEDEPPVVTLELKSGLKERRLSRSDDLPGSIIVPTTNFDGVPVSAALQAVLAGTDVSLSWDSRAWEDRLVSVTNLSGPLPRVVDKICSSAKVFCSHRSGLLELKEKETFIIELPRMPGKGGDAATNSMAEAIEGLAGDTVKIDQQGGNLIYTTDVEGHEAVSEYLEQLRNGRPLVVVQLHIWEVTLNKENAEGINWTSFSFPDIGGNWEKLALAGSTAFTEAAASSGVSLGATLSGKVNATSVLEFLSTQGRVQTISSPQLTFVSGSNAEFRIGGKQKYVSEVGQLVSSSVSGTSSSNSSIGTNTVSTDTVDTGLTVDINGSFEGGVVTANLEITMQSLVRVDSVSSGGTSIQLPVTSDRKVASVIRVRPGDNLVLAGMVSSRDTNSREGIPLPFNGNLPTLGSDELENSELVVLVKPSVVLFSDKAIKAAEKRKRDNVMSSRPLPDAVIIDKDGAKTVNMLDTTVSSYGDSHASINRGAVVEEASPPVPLQDAVMIDKRMMQRGFSRAFDEVEYPSSNPGGGGQ